VAYDEESQIGAEPKQDETVFDVLAWKHELLVVPFGRVRGWLRPRPVAVVC
jgi:hypothetical protein